MTKIDEQLAHQLPLEETIPKKELMSLLECPVCFDYFKPPLQVYKICFFHSIDPISSRYYNVQKAMWFVGVVKSGQRLRGALSAASRSTEIFRETEFWKSCQERCSHSKQSRRRSQLEKGNKFHPRRMSTRFVYRRLTIWGFLTEGWVRWMWYIIISI